MSYSNEDVERIRRILSARHHFAEKKMMGGLVFMVDGHMCCALSHGALLVRVGSEARARLLALRHVQPMGFGGRTPIGFVHIDPAGWQTARTLAAWLQRGLDFVATLPAKKTASRSPRPKASRKKAARRTPA